MDYDYVVIGAGVVGLAVAAELALRGSLVVLEKEAQFGQGTSSRNSEVVHAGLYYAPGSLKSRLCIEGRKVIEELAVAGVFGYSRIGKYIVATDERERGLLGQLKANAETCGVKELWWAEVGELREEEPDVRALSALFSSQTGIVDSYGLMNHFHMTALEAGADFAYHSEVVGIRLLRSSQRRDSEPTPFSTSPANGGGIGYEVTVRDGTAFSAKCIINCAGLYADRVAEMSGMDVHKLGLELKWSRGTYYGIESEAGLHLSHLVYPVPDHARASLGVHVCVDLSGGIRFGPTAEYLREKIEDYAPPEGNVERVAEALSRYLPKVRTEYLHPMMAGIRPKLFGPGERVRDFYIQEESARGLPGLVNLIGIESPGLTAAPGIAKYVRDIITRHERS